MIPAIISEELDDIMLPAHSRYLAEFESTVPGTLNAPWATLDVQQREGLRAMVLFVYGKAIEECRLVPSASKIELVDEPTTFQFAIGQWVQDEERVNRGRIVARFDVGDADEPGYRVMWIDSFGKADLVLLRESDLHPTGEEA